MSEIKTVEYKDLGIKYYTTVHKSGLEITLIPKDISENYALFSTRYGGADNCFKLDGEAEFTRVPDGIAHYLEHKMFENEDGVDTFSRFAKYGANANAFTSDNITAYLFGATDSFKENLEILLDYVTHPYFTDENVAKEQGIIGQEIKMGEDNPHRAVYQNLKTALYKDSQANVSVIGTVESIAKITPELLYSCYNTFYNLSNMMLVVSGRATMDDILEVCDKVLRDQKPVKIIRSYNDEQRRVNMKRISKEFEIAKPIFRVGVKDPVLASSADERMKRNAAGTILYQLLFGETSSFSVEVYESGMINDFHGYYDSGKICAYGTIGGESDDPEAAYEKIVSYIEQKKKDGFSKADFERIKKAEYAEMVRSLDSPHLPNNVTFYKIDDIDMFDYIECLKHVEFEDMQPLCEEMFKEEYFCMSVAYPIKK